MPFLTELCINELTIRCYKLNLNELIKVYEKVFLLKETQRNSFIILIEEVNYLYTKLLHIIYTYFYLF